MPLEKNLQGNPIAEPRSLSPLQKAAFFVMGLFAAFTIFLLINKSNLLTLEKETEALAHFEEIANHSNGHELKSL